MTSCTLFILYKSCKHTCEALALNLLYSFKAHHFDIFVGTELNEIFLLSFIYVSSCWEINLSIYFRQRHLCHWRHYFFQSFGPSRVKSGCINWLLLRSFRFFCIWSPQFILNTRLLGHSTVSRSTLYSWLIPLWPFDIGMGFLCGCILSIHTAWSVLTLKLTEKKRLIQTLVKCNILTACLCKWPWNR